MGRKKRKTVIVKEKNRQEKDGKKRKCCLSYDSMLSMQPRGILYQHAAICTVHGTRLPNMLQQITRPWQ